MLSLIVRLISRLVFVFRIGLFCVVPLSLLGLERPSSNASDLSSKIAVAEELLKKGSPQRAVSRLNEVIKSCRTTDMMRSEVRARVVLAEAYHALGERRLAVETLQLALALAEREKSRSDLIAVKCALGTALSPTRDGLLADRHLRQALTLANEGESDPAAIAAIRNNLGKLLAAQNRFADALNEFDASAAAAARADDAALGGGWQEFPQSQPAADRFQLEIPGGGLEINQRQSTIS